MVGEGDGSQASRLILPTAHLIVDPRGLQFESEGYCEAMGGCRLGARGSARCKHGTQASRPSLSLAGSPSTYPSMGKAVGCP